RLQPSSCHQMFMSGLWYISTWLQLHGTSLRDAKQGLTLPPRLECNGMIITH
ncbi:AAMDC isoform 3, partial [Pongo abelii]